MKTSDCSHSEPGTTRSSIGTIRGGSARNRSCPSTLAVRLARTRTLSRARACDTACSIARTSALPTRFIRCSSRIRSRNRPTSRCWYHASRVFIPAARRIWIRYELTPAVTIARRSDRSNPRSRPNTSKLAAIRFRSHSHGPGSVSSKSLTSKTIWRSGVPNTPKFERCASPHSWTVMPELGVDARSAAMMSAAPRKNVNGEISIRPWRIGTSSGTRVASCSSSRAIGSGRSGDGVHRPWADRGASWRAAFPRATRSVSVRCARRQADANGASIGPQSVRPVELGKSVVATAGSDVSSTRLRIVSARWRRHRWSRVPCRAGTRQADWPDDGAAPS